MPRELIPLALMLLSGGWFVYELCRPEAPKPKPTEQVVLLEGIPAAFMEHVRVHVSVSSGTIGEPYYTEPSVSFYARYETGEHIIAGVNGCETTLKCVPPEWFSMSGEEIRATPLGRRLTQEVVSDLYKKMQQGCESMGNSFAAGTFHTSKDKD